MIIFWLFNLRPNDPDQSFKKENFLLNDVLKRRNLILYTSNSYLNFYMQIFIVNCSDNFNLFQFFIEK